MQPLPGKAPFFVDEEVIHNAAQPGARLVDFDEIVDLAKDLDEEFLEQVLGFGFSPGQPKSEAIQPVEMRPDEALERVMVLSDDRLLKVVKVRPAIR